MYMIQTWHLQCLWVWFSWFYIHYLLLFSVSKERFQFKHHFYPNTILSHSHSNVLWFYIGIDLMLQIVSHFMIVLSSIGYNCVYVVCQIKTRLYYVMLCFSNDSSSDPGERRRFSVYHGHNNPTLVWLLGYVCWVLNTFVLVKVCLKMDFSSKY